MELHYPLPLGAEAALDLAPDESVLYCIPVDLSPSGELLRNCYFTVTQRRILILESGGVTLRLPLADIEKAKCEPMAGCGIIFARLGGEDRLLARFSMKHIIRASYVAGGINRLLAGEEEPVVSDEPETECPVCRRAMVGSSKCPYCAGRAQTFAKFLRLVRPWYGSIAVITAVMLCAVALQVGMQYLQRFMIDNVLVKPGAIVSQIWPYIGGIAACTAALLAATVVRSRLCVNLGSTLSMSLRSKLFDKIQQQSIHFIGRRQEGDLLNRVTNDTRIIREFFEGGFSWMFSTLIQMAVMIVVMCFLSWKLTLLSVALVPVVFWMLYQFFGLLFYRFHLQQGEYDKLASGLQDVLSGIREVKSYGLEASEAARFIKNADRFTGTQVKNETFWAVYYPIIGLLLGFGIYFVVLFGGGDVLAGRFTIGEFTQFMAATAMLYGPLQWMSYLPRMVINTVSSFERISDVLESENGIAYREAEPRSLTGWVRFENVGFGYNSYEPVLEDISFDTRPGDYIGIVGSSGAGKSTLVNLLMRLYDADRGRITVDGQDIREVGKDDLHGKIGVVLQETFLFSGTVIENIRFSKPDATEQEVIAAAKLGGAHDFICQLPDGYNTKVGERGHSLSGGERQRIAIARAVLPQPSILILDEATSSLDTQSEDVIQQAFDRLSRGRTTFAIAHRLSTLRNATRILVIDRHRIVESGTHEELSGIPGGVYAQLVRAQLEMFGDEGAQAAAVS